MTDKKMLAAACAALVLASGCSSRPREFIASLSAPAADQSAFERDLATCRTLVAQGHRSGFVAAAVSGGAGVVASVGAAGAAGAAGLAGPFMGATAGATVAAAVPLVGVLAAWGVARGVRTGRERRQNEAMSDCLAEHGYAVEGWTPVGRASRSRRPSSPHGSEGEGTATPLEPEGSAL